MGNIGPRSWQYGPSAARSVQKRPRAYIPQYGPEQVKLVSSLLDLYGDYMASFFVRNNTSAISFKSISGAVSRKQASDFNWLSNQFDDRCRRSAKTCVAFE